MTFRWLAETMDRGRAPGAGGREASVRYVRDLVFGDRVGAVVWLGAVLWLGLWWRVGFFITDTYPIANAVANLAEGTLGMRPADFRYSLTLGTQPGLHRVDGLFYARNYGQVVAALPFVWVLQAASTLADPRLVLAGGWSLGVVVLGRESAAVLGRSRLRLGAVAVAGLSLVGSVAFATDLPAERLPLVALQLSTIAAAALAAVWCYRLVLAFHGRRVAVSAGVGVVLATPVGFWASIPKRHVIVTMLVFASVYAFAASRRRDGVRSDLALGGAYGALGLVAWVHAFEGLFLVAALVVVDLVTEPRKGPRRLAIATGVFALSVLPMVLTNWAISGNPLRPPRLLPDVGPGSVEFAPEATGGDGGGAGGTGSGGEGTQTPDDGTGTAAGGTDATATPEPTERSAETATAKDDGGGVGAAVAGARAFAGRLWQQLTVVVAFAVEAVTMGLDAVTETDRIWEVFVRRGRSDYVGGLAASDFELIDLSVLESTPVVGALIGLPVTAVTTLRRHRGAVAWRSPRRQTDLLVAAYVVVLTVIYLPRLPLFSQITVRYLLPVIALLAHLVVRLPAVRAAITDATVAVVLSYVGTLAIGAVGVVVGLGALEPALGEAVQCHAWVNLGVAGTLGSVVTARTAWPDRIPAGAVAVALGLAAGAATVFVVFGAVEYFRYGPFALDIVGEIARQVSIL